MSPPTKKAWFDQYMVQFAADLAPEYAPATIKSHVDRVRALLRMVHGPNGRLDRMQQRYAGYAPKMRSLAALSWRLYQDGGGIPTDVVLDAGTPLPPPVARAVYLLRGQIGVAAIRRLRWADVEENAGAVQVTVRGNLLAVPGLGPLLPAMRAWAFGGGTISPTAPLIPASEGSSAARDADALAVDADAGAAVPAQQGQPTPGADADDRATTRPRTPRTRGLPHDAVLALQHVLASTSVPARLLPKLIVSDFVHEIKDGVKVLVHIRNAARSPGERGDGQIAYFRVIDADATLHFTRYLALVYPDGYTDSALAVPDRVNGTSPCSPTQARIIRSLNLTKG